jgi:hypothetical protein
VELEVEAAEEAVVDEDEEEGPLLSLVLLSSKRSGEIVTKVENMTVVAQKLKKV